jgi:nicotinate-nucleotide pyrophosphorylase (carboxylating)
MLEDSSFMTHVVRLALEEDVGRGDLTTESVVDPATEGRAVLIAKEELVLAGLPVFKKTFWEVDPGLTFRDFFGEGDLIPADAEICRLTGRLGSMLKGERTALNFLQRMSGIATMTRRYVDKVKKTKAKILDTRKTVPGLRQLDKYAVRIGGGHNHRFGLYDGILIKDNHIVAAGSITRAIDLARRGATHTIRIEVEVEDLQGVREACKAGADAILLDNMEPQELENAVEVIDGTALVEASGGITLDTVAAVAMTGVDLISVGALTHSPKAADLSLAFISDEGLPQAGK